VHLAVTLELGLFQPGDQAEYPLLFGKFQVGLEADQVVKIPG
jgi:hypothetical protein